MRIAYLSLLAPPGELAGSGVPKVSETLLREYETVSGIDVHALSLIDGLQAPVTEVRGSVTYRYLPCAGRGKTLTFYAREVARLKREVRLIRPDIVHGQPNADGLLAATGWGGSHVVTIHGLVLREMANHSKLTGDFWTNLIREMLQRRAIRRARNIISISPYVDDYLAGRGEARVWPISNPIDPEFFNVGEPARPGLRILCVGIVSLRKNQRLLVRACGQLESRGTPFSCRIVGRIDAATRNDLEGMIRESGLSGKVSLMGLVSREELLDSYRWASCVVLPSREETAPLSMIQGMAAGRCVFGANAAGIPALLEGGKWGDLVDPDEPGDLALRLEAFASEPGPFLCRAALASDMAHTRFKPSSVARQTIGLYRDISSDEKRN